MRDVVVGSVGVFVGAALGSGALLVAETALAGTVVATLMFMTPQVAAPQVDETQPHYTPVAAVVAEAPKVATRPVVVVRTDLDAELERLEREIEVTNRVIDAEMDQVDRLMEVNVGGLKLPIPIPKLSFGKRKGRGRR